MELLKLVNPHRVSDEEVRAYRLREAARGIVLDWNRDIAMIHLNIEKWI